ncbi:MAG: hypothetical protein HND49_03450 [Planctomycetes bacterium]|nr:hypothetical protein [Planctomycetota bacterium]
MSKDRERLSVIYPSQIVSTFPCSFYHTKIEWITPYEVGVFIYRVTYVKKS